MFSIRCVRLMTWIGAVMTGMALWASAAAAQTSARIEGIVTDDSGGVMPGVTITLTSPALQVPQITTVTDGKGEYRFLELRAGMYRLQFELSGFQTFVREQLEVSTGFAARVNTVLKVEGLNESVTVSGVSPIVDISTTSGGQIVDTEKLITSLPAQKTIADLVALSPGMVNTDGHDPGALSLQGRPRFNTYGLGSNNTNTTMMIDGLLIVVNTPINDIGATQEVDIRTFGNGADVKEPGAFVNMVLNSGGDTFHGSVTEAFMKQPSGNIDDELRRRHFTVPGQLKYFNDASADLGGRIIPRTLWFYGAYRKRVSEQSQPGLVLNAGPDGRFKTGDEPPAYVNYMGKNITGRLSYQITSAYSVNTSIIRDGTTSSAQSGNYANTPYDSTATLAQYPSHTKLEFKGAPSRKLYLNVVAGHSGWFDPDNGYHPQESAKLIPTSTDRTTLMNSGASVDRRVGKERQTSLTASVTFLPDRSLGGQHEFKAGYFFYKNQSTDMVPNREYGNYTLVFDNGVPFQFVALNSPVDPEPWDDSWAVYITDRWRIGQRLTLNLGLRWDAQHSYNAEQTREAGQWPFAQAQTFPKVEVLKYDNLAPRLGLAYDVTGGGKTVVKATYGLFNPLARLAGNFNPNAAFSNTYLWRDLNNNRDYDPGEVDLSLTGRDFVSTGSPTFALLNPDLKLAKVREFTSSIEHELSQGMSVRGLYLRRIDGNRTGSVSLLRPYEIYNRPLSRQDPGPDGTLGTADDGGMVTIYDYDARYRPATFTLNQTQNAPSSVPNNYVQSMEAAFTKRQGARWLGTVSFSANNIRSYTWIQNPNQEPFSTSNTWTWNSKINGYVNLPYDISAGAIVEIFSGPQGRRTYIFRAADPLGGPALQGLTTITLNMEPAGSRKEPAYALVNARVSKAFRFKGIHQLRLSFDALNLLNTNAVLGVSYASGPTFGDVTDAVPPRNLKVGLAYSF